MTPINWNPYTANPLDYVGKDLVSPSGEKVVLSESCKGFSFSIGGQFYSGLSNVEACRILFKEGIGVNHG